jgi:hypothetical protein
VLEDLVTDSTERAIWNLWEPRIFKARQADNAAAESVQELIAKSRRVIEQAGHTRDSDLILYSLFIKIHWDCDRPTDRVFETMLGFELESFFKERMN